MSVVRPDVGTAVTSLGEEARTRREELTEHRCIPADLFRRAGEAGLFRQLVSVELGGLGLSPTEWFDNVVEIARLEPSFGWVVAQGAGDLATYLAAGTARFAEECLADTCCYIASSDAGRGTVVADGDGHYIVEGRWGFCSGSDGATWLGGWASFEGTDDGSGEPRGAMVLVPAERATIDRNWHVVGMIGTGSHSIELPRQRVPAHWVIPLLEQGPEEYGQMMVTAGSGQWPVHTGVCATVLGMAQEALELADEILPRKGDPPATSNAAVQRRVMHARAEWASARAGVRSALERIWREAETSPRLSNPARVELVIANAHATRAAIGVVDEVCSLVGTTVARADLPLAQLLLDVRVLGSHFAVSEGVLESAAQVHYGVIDPPFIV
jgi:indole-3-acetate monooxygenase